MTTFETPAPISARLELTVAQVLLAAGDRTDTRVEVLPAHPDHEADVEAARRVTVEFDDGTLWVRSPKHRTHTLSFGRGSRPGSVRVTVALPARSRVRGSVAVGTITATGRLGDCDLTSASGDVRLAEVADLTASLGASNLQVDRVTGSARVSGAAGATRLGTVEGPAVLKGAVGVIRVGLAAGDLRISSASGDITVDRALATVVAKTAAGRVTVGEAGGSAELETGGGSLAVGIPAGTAAWVDARSVLGRVRNELESTDAPEGSERTVRVRARTAIGDIRLFRAEHAGAAT